MHCHILPGIDDGARDEETSLRMLEQESREGAKAVIFTPHFKPSHRNASPQQVIDLTDRLQDLTDEIGLKLDLYPGNEILYFGEVPELLAQGKILTLAGSDHVLIEFHPADPYDRIRQGVYEILAAGFVPVLAHVERYNCILEHPERADELIGMGGRIQVNAMSVLGKSGFRIRQFTRNLIRNDRVDFLSTDAHDLKYRPVKLKECAMFVCRKYGKACAQRILYANAQEIILSGAGADETESEE